MYDFCVRVTTTFTNVLRFIFIIIITKATTKATKAIFVYNDCLKCRQTYTDYIFLRWLCSYSEGMRFFPMRSIAARGSNGGHTRYAPLVCLGMYMHDAIN